MSTLHIIKCLLNTGSKLQRNKALLTVLSIVLILSSTLCLAEDDNDIPPTLSQTIKNTEKNTNTSDILQSSSTLPEYVVILPSDEATFSSETSASVDTITVKEGSTFHKGDILIKLDCRVQDADLKKARAQQEVATLAFVSAKKLKSYGSISELEYVQAETQKSMANADVDKLAAIVEKCTIKAPFNGSVAKLMVHQFETVKPGDPLIKIISIDNLDFVVQVPSSWLEWLHVNSLFTVHVNEIDKAVPVKVTKINPEIDSVSQTVKVIAKLTNPDPSLLPGMSGQASFPDKPTTSNKIN